MIRQEIYKHLIEKRKKIKEEIDALDSMVITNKAGTEQEHPLFGMLLKINRQIDQFLKAGTKTEEQETDPFEGI